MNKYYVFTVKIGGYGKTIEEAWGNAALEFALEPGSSDDVVNYKILDEHEDINNTDSSENAIQT